MAATDAAEALLRMSGALLEDDHFVYVSGQHGSGWIDKDAVYPHTERTSALAEMIAEAVRDRGIDGVCGPATGGLIIAPWVAHHLGVLAVFGEHGAASRDGGARPHRRPFTLKRGYDRLVAHRNVLVVDDVINTGPSDGCPLCRDGIPVNPAYAHGADYLAARGNCP